MHRGDDTLNRGQRRPGMGSAHLQRPSMARTAASFPGERTRLFLGGLPLPPKLAILVRLGGSRKHPL